MTDKLDKFKSGIWPHLKDAQGIPFKTGITPEDDLHAVSVSFSTINEHTMTGCKLFTRKQLEETEAILNANPGASEKAQKEHEEMTAEFNAIKVKEDAHPAEDYSL